MATLGEQVTGYKAHTLGEEVSGGYQNNEQQIEGIGQHYSNGEESMADIYGAKKSGEGYGNKDGKGGSGYKSLNEQKEHEKKEEESNFDKLIKEESKNVKQENKDDDIRAAKTPQSMEDFGKQIDINQIRENIEKQKEEKVKKELEDAIKGEQLEEI